MSNVANRKPAETGSDIVGTVTQIARESQKAYHIVSKASSKAKDEALREMARALEREADYILAENAKDLDALDRGRVTKAYVDRLTLTPARIRSMAEGLREVAAQPDPVGEMVRMWRRPNGLWVGRMRIPLGVICIIYEARPNVTADAAGLCIKAGNAVILRGGSDSIRSNLAIGSVLRAALEKHDLPADAVSIVPVADREAVLELLHLDGLIDLVIPRGGEGLIRFVAENSRIPVLKHYKGVCHIYIDGSADIEMAVDVCVNAKVQRPGVCNAVETVLVHADIAPAVVPPLCDRLIEHGVTIRGCPRTRAIDDRVAEANEDDWYEEYLDLILSMKVVGDMDEAIAHIAKYGSMHTESIITRDYANAQRFVREVDSSTVMVNASTRFADGYELGLGAEIGISTSKLHAFGPMGVGELTTTKFVVFGDGQVRT